MAFKRVHQRYHSTNAGVMCSETPPQQPNFGLIKRTFGKNVLSYQSMMVFYRVSGQSPTTPTQQQMISSTRGSEKDYV